LSGKEKCFEGNRSIIRAEERVWFRAMAANELPDLVYQFIYQFDRKKTDFLQLVKNKSGSEKTQKAKKTGSYR
jgi:hypothetical protein